MNKTVIWNQISLKQTQVVASEQGVWYEDVFYHAHNQVFINVVKNTIIVIEQD